MNEYTFKEIKVGTAASFQRIITADMENTFRDITRDENPLHKEDVFAVQIGGGKFKGHIAFGMLTASLYSTLAGVYLPGKYSLIHSIDKLQFRKAVFVGDKLEVSGRVIDKEEQLRLIIIGAEIKNQDGQCVSKAKMKVLVLR